jgi:EAL domain-containing protein (putative c-di-GMP-specific phosphodiesterase class I)
LNYIRRLPIEFLKIDKGFIDSADADDVDGKLTAAIVGLAKVLNLGCVAEGVERPAQAERLTELGCDYVQGLLLARPLSADALRELLDATVPTTRPEPAERPRPEWPDCAQRPGRALTSGWMIALSARET